MNPKIENISEEDDILKFKLSNTNVSISNSLRRTMISDIPTVVFKTNQVENYSVIINKNTTMFNNEIIKQRIGCIPVHIINTNEFPLENLQVELDVENNSDSIIVVTTQDFKIKDLSTDKYLSDTQVKEIFPPNDYTGDYIDLIRLRPKCAPELEGEKISLTGKLSIGTAKEDGMFNVTSRCSYSFTIDTDKQKTALDIKKQEWKDEGKNKEAIIFEEDNWKLLEGKRFTLKDSFNFEIETVGVYNNYEIVKLGCEVLIKRLEKLNAIINIDKLKIDISKNTMTNCFDIILENEDYTIGKIIEYLLYTKFYEKGILTYCGFKKMHPHDSESIIRVAYKDAIDVSSIKGHLTECIIEAQSFYEKIKKNFIKK